MIEHLEIGRSGHFFLCKRPLTNKAIEQLFRDVRAQARQPMRSLFRVVRASLRNAHYSAICFSYEGNPPFLTPEAGAVERTFGYLLVVECGSYVAIFRSGLDVTPKFKSVYLGKIASERVERVIAQHDAVFERLQLRKMSISPLTLRSKTLEARNLENSIATVSASRFIPQRYSVRRPDGIYSATPATGRIAVRGDRKNIEETVSWASEISAQLEANNGTVSSFIRKFARSLELRSLPATVHPTFVGIDIMGLSEAIFDVDDGIRLVQNTDNNNQELSQADIEAILTALDHPFSVIIAEGSPEVQHVDGQIIAKLRIGQTRIALQKFKLTELETIAVEHRNFPVGEDPNAIPLGRYIDQENLFTVLFSDLTLAYIDGTLFRDEALAGGGRDFLSHLHIERALENVTSEKGNFQTDQVEFSPNSVFRTVVDAISSDDVLLCDDLGDEWADFIGISSATNPMAINFYHAKHGNPSLSASAFHDSVGQAIKNLGNIALPSEKIAPKLERWNNHYRNDRVQTQIARMIRGGQSEQIAVKIEEARLAPDVLQRVFIVTSSLSRTQVEEVFAAARQGQPPSPHFVQLYWLLMSYFSACVEMGVRGYVVCRP